MEFPWLVVVGIVVVAEAAELAGIEVVVATPAGIVAEAVFGICCYYYCP